MNRRARMLSTRDRIERSLDSIPRGSSLGPAKREGARKVTMLAACVAVAVIVSGALLLFTGTGADQPTAGTPGASSGIGVEQPHPIMGYCYDSEDNPVTDCTVTVTYWENETTSYSGQTTSNENGLYQFDIQAFPGDWLPGKYVEVEAVNATHSGWADGYTTSAYYDIINVTMDTEIPEFTTVMAPVAGILLLFAFARIRRRKKSEA